MKRTNRMTSGTGAQLRIFFGLILCALWGPALAGAAQATAMGQTRVYSLRYASAADVSTQLQGMVGTTAEVLLDRQHNRIQIRGPETAQRVAAQLIETIDRPVATTAMQQPQPSEELVRGYNVPLDQLSEAANRLRAQFADNPQVRVAEDSRTAQLIVVGPASAHREVAQALAAMPAGDGRTVVEPRRMPQVAPAVSRHQLRHISWRDFEDALRRLGGDAIQIVPQDNGEVATLRIMVDEETQDVLRVDRRNQLVEFIGGREQRLPWQRVLTALDQPRDLANASTSVIPLNRANPQQIQDTLSMIRKASLTKQDEVTAARSVGSARRRRGDLVSMIFQESQPGAGQTPPGVGQPGAEQPAEGQPGTGEAGPEGGQGLIGDVQIEFIPELGVIILKGKQADVERVQRIIDEIEQQSVLTQPEVHLFHLRHTNSVALGELITQVYTTVYEPRQGQLSITPLVKPNTLLVIGRIENIRTAAELIEKLDQPVAASTQLKVFQLQHMAALDAQNYLNTFYGNAAAATQAPGVAAQPGVTGAAAPGVGLATRVNVISDFRSNSLIVQASPRDMVEVEEIIESLDIDSTPASLELKVLPLRNSLASELAGVLQNALGVQATNPTQQQGAGVQAAGAAGGNVASQQLNPVNKTIQVVGIDTEGRAIIESGILSDVTVTADANTNALIVRAPPNSMSLVEELVRQLDIIPGAESQIKVFEVSNGDATNLTVMLQQLFGQEVTAGQLGAFSQTFGSTFGAAATGVLQSQTAGESSLIPLRFAVDARTNSIIATGSAGDLNVVEAILLRLDAGDLRLRKNTVYRLNNAPAQFVADALTQILQQNQQLLAQQQGQQFSLISQFEYIDSQIFVVPEVISNSLIVSATPQYFDQIATVIADLDRRPPMIMVQVVLAQMTLNTAEELGVELGIQDSLLFDRGVSAAGMLVPGFNWLGLPLGNGDSAASLATRNNLAGQGVSSFNVGRSSAGSGFGGMVLSASNESVNILIRALEAESRLQVLFRPYLMTLNNVPASVLIGQRVPRVTDFQVTTSGTVNSVDLDEVGLSLGVIPRVSPDGMIQMDIEVNNSRVGPVEDGIPIGVQDGVAINSPIFDDITAITTITARSGQTVVFSGLINTEKSRNFRGVPVLSHIPVLGQLFRFDTETDARRELVIFMTPHIVASGEYEDVSRINQTEADRLSWCFADVVEIHGDPGFYGDAGAFGPEEAPLIGPNGIQPLPGPVGRPAMEPVSPRNSGGRPFVVPPSEQQPNREFVVPPDQQQPNLPFLNQPPSSSRRDPMRTPAPTPSNLQPPPPVISSPVTFQYPQQPGVPPAGGLGRPWPTAPGVAAWSPPAGPPPGAPQQGAPQPAPQNAYPTYPGAYPQQARQPQPQPQYR